MHELRLKPRDDHSSYEVRQNLVDRFNNALGPPNNADQAIQQAFLKGTMTPGETQLFVSMCEYVINAVDRHSSKSPPDR